MAAIIQRSFGIAREDVRRHVRVSVALTARCMFEDRREATCRVLDMSVGGAAIEAPAQGHARERVVAYVDEIGRIEGRIVRRFSGGFAITWNATPARQDKLAERLTWILNRARLGFEEGRRHDRIVPARPWSSLVFADGTRVRCRIVDVSPSGAAIHTDLRPAIGEPVFLGRMSGTVVRSGEGSVGIEFDHHQSRNDLQDQFGRLLAAE